MAEPTIDDVVIDPKTGMPKLPDNQFWRVQKGEGKYVTVHIVQVDHSQTLQRWPEVTDKHAWEAIRAGKVEYLWDGHSVETSWEITQLLDVFPWPRRVQHHLYTKKFYTTVTSPSSMSATTSDISPEAVQQVARQIYFRQILKSYRGRTEQDAFQAVVGDYPPKSLPLATNVAIMKS